MTESLTVDDNGMVIYRLPITDAEGVVTEYQHHQVEPGQDYSKEPAEVKEACKKAHTTAVIKAYKDAPAQE